MKPIVVVVALAGIVGACGGGSSEREAPDARDEPAGAIDAAGEVDAGDVDGGAVDGGDVDGGAVDGGHVDGGVIVVDGGNVDAAPPANILCGPVHSIGVSGDAVHQPELAIDGAGDAIALWRQGAYSQNNGMGSVRGGRFDRESGWGTATAFAHGGSSYPSKAIAVDAAGRALAVWQDSDAGSDAGIWTARYLPGTGWGAATALPTQAPFAEGGGPQVALDPAGNGAVVWRAADGTHAILYTAANGWGAEALLDAGNTGVGSVATGPGGTAMATWTRTVNGQPEVRASRLANGTWGAPVTVGPVGSVPLVGMDAQGNSIVVWTRYQDAGSELWTARHVEGVGWRPATRRDAADTYSIEARLAVAASGHAALVWMERVPTPDGGTMPRVALATFDPAADWSPTTIMLEDYSAFGGDVGIDATGHALAAWHVFEGTPDTGFATIVYARRFVPGAGWGPRFRLLPGEARDPHLVMNASGDAVVAWKSSTTATGSVLNACAYR